VSSRRHELILAAAGLIALAAVVYGPQIANGGFYWDDWQNAANVRFTPDPGLLGALSHATDRPVFGYRPVLTTMLVLEYEALGLNKELFLAVAALFGASTAWALYLLLRTLGVRAREAIVPAALLLVFPWVDSTRMWNTASFDTLAVTFYLLGLVLAIKALRARSRGLTVASAALYLAACWTYEVLAFGVLASVAVYLLVAPRRDALRRFALDAAITAVALALVALGTTRDPVGAGDQVEHALTLAEQSLELLGRALFPLGDGLTPLAALTALALGAVLAYRRRQLRPVALGALCVAAGYVLFIPAALYYEPLAPGTTNRMNVLAAVGFVVLVCALVRVASPSPAIAAVVLVAIGGGYVVKVREDQEGWQRSAEVQEQVLDAVRTTLPDPPEDATIYTFNAPSFVAAGIPAFSLQFDLRAAVRLDYDDHSLSAYPVRGLDVIRCEERMLHPVGGTYTRADQGARYGEAYFVDVRERTVVRIDSRAQCRREAVRLVSV
jgi:hypothetical protein